MKFGKTDTNFCFEPGKLTVLLDVTYGSSAKGKLASFITEHATNWDFCCNAFMPNAGHWVKLDDGREFFYQTFNSCAYNHEKFEKMYIGPGAVIELPAFWKELEKNGIPRNKIGISPIASILQDIDGQFEKGLVDIDGKPIEYNGIAIKSGTTAHGCGAARARKILRRSNVLLARDVPELKEFICDVPGEIMERLDRGQSGLLEIAQGFSLSMGLPEMYPHCTSRNVTVAAALDDMMIPPVYAGNVVLNIRAFPIRINSKKFVTKDGKHLTWAEVQSGQFEYNVEDSNSGHWYPDQKELTWEEVTKESESPVPIMEMTSVTKLPRRIASYSKINTDQAIIHNNTGHKIILSINFINYVDYAMTGRREILDGYIDLNTMPTVTVKALDFLTDNVFPTLDRFEVKGHNINLNFIGTGAKTDDTILIKTN